MTGVSVLCFFISLALGIVCVSAAVNCEAELLSEEKERERVGD